MPRACTICTHPQRDEIEDALIRSQPLRHIAKQHGLPDHSALHRHKQDHLPAALVTVASEREAQRARTLLDRIEELESKARTIFESAEKEGRTALSIQALRELRGIVELFGKATGELRESPQLSINLLVHPEWVRIRGAMMEALAEFPEARLAVAEKLRKVQAEPAQLEAGA